MTVKTNIPPRASSIRHGMRAAMALSLGVLALAGCKHDEGPQVAGWTLVDPEQRHPIMVSQQPSHLNIKVARGSQGLVPAQRAEVLEFASRYRSGDAGNSRIVISAPSGGANEGSAMMAAQEAHDLLVRSGFSEADVAIEAYTDSGREPPVRISYLRYIAEGPSCAPNWPENLANNPSNGNYTSFGCSNQRALAAMVANPADLLGPRTEGTRYSDRRDNVMNNYSKGKPTGADKTDDERVQVKGAN